MTQLSDGRPQPRTRTQPRPAADESHDPIDQRPAIPQQTSPSRQGPQPTVQLNVRISPDVADLISRMYQATNQSKRELIEHAIRSTYAT